ncbi:MULTISPECIES: HAD family hydrolase [unclassified Fusibacter]|uniref:HAD family hydrolase n=1 Tax=unclassified Fusibacter TaxID=2624464 RepID=UPI001010412A|nr:MULTISPECIES: HAD family hydrolase [unclassified Fusibacter]MCK8060346.1 HAD family hydrolase [Fusibacter sp. A2]NPE20365.1 HAD family hydrolase [Fusibacter sp. A1]RXV63571.1 HAD family hydrolase [Fusibacter sp. A1]
MLKRNIKTLYFDYDGTLHDSIAVYAPAFRKAFDYLVEHGYANERSWADDEIAKWLGYNKEAMWQAFMPDLPEALKQEAGMLIGTEMNRRIEKGEARLYKHSLKVLRYLRQQGYRLVFISNCSDGYMQAHKKQFGLDDYFDEFITSQAYDYLPKWQILSILRGNQHENALMIGDRWMDMEAGIKNNMQTIGCRYGFGTTKELENATVLIDDVGELMGIL